MTSQSLEHFESNDSIKNLIDIINIRFQQIVKPYATTTMSILFMERTVEPSFHDGAFVVRHFPGLYEAAVLFTSEWEEHP